MRPTSTRWTGQQGFSLISALFIVVILSALAAALVNLVATERRTSTMAVQGARAYQAARSGLDWAVAKLVADPTSCPTATWTLTEGGLRGFSVDVSCAGSVHTESGNALNVVRVTVEAEYAAFGSPDYVRRRLEATLTAGP